MEEIRLEFEDDERGGFNYYLDGEKEGYMTVRISDGTLFALHTEVSEKLEGKGIASMILDAMVNYARQNGYSVIPRCTYVQKIFKRFPEKYADLRKD